jgi:hypothetical protein
MSTYNRNGNRWTINEILSLQREYELLEWSVEQISKKHERTVMAILCKLKAEGFISCFKEARGFDVEAFKKSIMNDNTYQDDENDEDYEEEEDDENEDDCDDDEYNYEEEEASEVEQLTERVWSLETSVNEISSIVKNIFGILMNKQTSEQTLGR